MTVPLTASSKMNLWSFKLSIVGGSSSFSTIIVILQVDIRTGFPKFVAVTVNSKVGKVSKSKTFPGKNI